MKQLFFVLYALTISILGASSLYAQQAKTIKNRAASQDLKLETTGGSMTLDGPTGNFGLGLDVPIAKVHIFESASGATTPDIAADGLVLEANGNTGITFMTPSTGLAPIYWSDPGSAFAGFLYYDHNNDNMFFGSNGTTEMRIKPDNGGRVEINGDIKVQTQNIRMEFVEGNIANGASLANIEVGSAGLAYSGTIHAFCIQVGDINDQTYKMIHTNGRGNNAVFTDINTRTVTSGCAFTVDRPFDRNIRLTNNSGVNCNCTMYYNGVTNE